VQVHVNLFLGDLEMDFLRAVFSPNDFMPHGYCYLWNTNLVWLHVVSDSLIALAYFSIPITLVYFIRKRRDLPFNWIFVCFGVFILACGATHAMEVWTLWHATYWLSGITKAVTALVSVPTAVLLVRLIPQALALPSPEELRREITERKLAQEGLSAAKADLELRVQERTADLTQANQVLTVEIRQRKRTQEELLRSEERFRLLVETVQDYAIFMLDPSGLVASWNVGAENIKGYRSEEIIGQHISRFFSAEDVERREPERELEVAVKEGRFHDEGWRIRKDGSRFWASVVITALRDPQGKLVGFSKITRDLTERKQAERALQEAKAEMAHMARVTTMGELAASIAHEINQPLSAIVNNANASTRMLAAQPPDLEEVRLAVSDIASAGTRAAEVISRIRTFLKKAVPGKAQVDVNQVIREVLALTVGELEKHHVSVRSELASGLAPVQGDRIQLQQVILNLILNGIEAMTSVSDRERVLMIRSQPDDPGGVLVNVQDSGSGLDPKNLGHVFDTFFTTKPSGMGMGLPISRSIVEAHGGRLWLTPNDGQGVTLQFTLPACA
jgi:PAS domain S-box-containing protein